MSCHANAIVGSVIVSLDCEECQSALDEHFIIGWQHHWKPFESENNDDEFDYICYASLTPYRDFLRSDYWQISNYEFVKLGNNKSIAKMIMEDIAWNEQYNPENT